MNLDICTTTNICIIPFFIFNIERLSISYLSIYCLSLGISMGRLRVHHQPDPAACVRAAHHGTLLAATVRQLHGVLHHRPTVLYADTVCRLPAYQDQ